MSGNMDEGAMKRQYAKELAAEMFARRHGIVPRRKPPDHEAKLRWARNERSARLVADLNKPPELYGVPLEQAHALTTALERALPRVKQKCAEALALGVVDEPRFLNNVLRELQAALWQCDLYFGLLQPGGDVIKYVAASPSSSMLDKELIRGSGNEEGVSFTVTDTHQPLAFGVPGFKHRANAKNKSLEGQVPKNTANNSKESEMDEDEDYEDEDDEDEDDEDGSGRRKPLPHVLGSGRHLPLVVFPLTASPNIQDGATLGVLGCDHFVAPPRFFRNDQGALTQRRERRRPFLVGGHLGSIDQEPVILKTRLWRHPSARAGTMQVRPHGGGGTCAAGIVSGKVIHVNRSNPTIGPVYTVEWQDGLRETGLNTKAMLELLEPTPRSLGHGTPATPEVIAVLETSASLVGKTLYALRRRKTFSALVATGQKANLSVRDAWAATADAIFAANPRATCMEVWEMQYPPPPRKPGGLFGGSMTSSSNHINNNSNNGSDSKSIDGTLAAAAAEGGADTATSAALSKVKMAKEKAAATAAQQHGPTVTVLAKVTTNGPPLRTMTANRKLNEVPFRKRKEMFSQIRAKHALASHALSSWLAREEAHETAVAQQRVAQQRQHREEEKDQQQQQQSSSSLPPLQAKQHPQKDVSSPQKAKASFEDYKSRPESPSSFSSSSSTAAKDDLSAVPPPAGPKREDWVKLVHGDEAASDVGMGGVGVFELPCAEIGPPVLLIPYTDGHHVDPLISHYLPPDKAKDDAAAAEEVTLGLLSKVPAPTAAASRHKGGDQQQAQQKAPNRNISSQKPVRLQLLAVTLRPAPPNKHPWFQYATSDHQQQQRGSNGGGREKSGSKTSSSGDRAGFQEYRDEEDKGDEEEDEEVEVLSPAILAARAARHASLALTSGDAGHATSLARELGRALGYSFARAARAEARRITLEQVRKVCSKWGDAEKTEVGLCDDVIKLLAPHLRGASLYVGTVQPGGNFIKYIAASPESQMVGQLLPRPSPGQPGGYAEDLSANQNQAHVLVHRELIDHSDEAHEPGVSFEALDGRSVALVRPPSYYQDPATSQSGNGSSSSGGVALVAGLQVDVRYGKRWYPATITKPRGRSCYDVQYDTGEIEAGVPALRLRPPLRATPTVHAFGAHGWPFLAAPLLHGAQFPNMIPVGILGVDGFELVARSHSGETQPEAGVPEWLFSAASFLGDAITLKRRTIALQRLGDVTVSFEATVDTLGQAAMRAIRECVLYARCVKVFESSEDMRDWAVTDAWVPPASSTLPLISGGGDDGTAAPTATDVPSAAGTASAAQSNSNEDDKERKTMLNNPNLISDPFRDELELGCSDSTLKKTWQPLSSQNLQPQELQELEEQELRHPGALRVKRRPEIAVSHVVDAGFRSFLRGAPPSLIEAFRGVPLEPETRYTIALRVRKENSHGSEVPFVSGKTQGRGGGGGTDGGGSGSRTGSRATTAADKPMQHASSSSLSSSPKLGITDEDAAFLGQISSALQVGIACVNGRAFRQEARSRALAALLHLCGNWQDDERPLDDVLKEVVQVLAVPLTGCCIYLGQLSPGGESIEYTHATENSGMVGMTLHRVNKRDLRRKLEQAPTPAAKKAVLNAPPPPPPMTFACIDQQDTILVADDQDPLAPKLHRFGPKGSQKWPFVCVPLSAGPAAVRGTVGVDNFEQCGKGRPDDEAPEPGVLDFLQEAATVVGNMVDSRSKAEALEALEDAILDRNLTVNIALDHALNAIAANVMFAQKVDVWQLSNIGRRKKKPLLSSGLSAPSSFTSAFGAGGSRTGDTSFSSVATAQAAPAPSAALPSKQPPQQQLPLVLVVELVRAYDLPKVRKFGKNNAYAMVKWGGREMGKSPVVVNSLAPEWKHRLVVPDVSNWNQANLEFQLWDYNKLSADSLVGEFSIAGDFLMHIKADGGEVFPLRMQANDPTSANRGFLEVNMSLQVAEFGFPPSVSPVPPQPVLNLHVHQAKGLAAADDNGASDPYAVVYFNDEEIGRTPVIFESLTPEWNASFVMDFIPKEALNAELVVDVYDHDEVGDHDFLGKVVLSGASLAKPKKGAVWYPLQRDKGTSRAAGPRSHAFVKGKIEMTLSVGEKEVNHFSDEDNSASNTNLNPSDVSVVAIEERVIGDNSLSNLISSSASSATANLATSPSRKSKKAKVKPEVELGDSRKLAVVHTSLSGLLHPCEVIPPDNEDNGGNDNGDSKEDEKKDKSNSTSKSKDKEAAASAKKQRDWSKAERVAAGVWGGTGAGWGREVLIAPFRDVAASVGPSADQVGPGNHGGCDFALVVKRKLGVEWHEDDAFVSDVVDRLQTLVRAVRGRELRSAIRLQSAKMIGQLCQLCRTSTDTALSSAIRALLKDSALTSNSSPAAGGQLDESHPVVSKILAAVGAKSSISNGGGSSAAASGGGGNKKKVNEEEVPEELNTDLLAGEEDALFEATLKLLERALPGVNLYVGLLRPGGNQLTFVAATAKSQMSGKAMQRGQGGVSFDCLGPGYAKNGVVVHGRGDGDRGRRVRCFEDEAKNQSNSPLDAAGAGAGEGGNNKSGSRLGSRLGVASGGSRPGTAFAPPPEGGMGLAGRGIWPFLAIPLVTPTGGTVGVLGCDDFSFVGKGSSFEEHPEEHPVMGVRDLLCAAGTALGSAIDGLRKGKALTKLLETVRSDPSITVQWLHREILRLLVENVLFLHAAEVWHLDSRTWRMSVASTAQSSEIAAKLDKNDMKRRRKAAEDNNINSGSGSNISSNDNKEKSSTATKSKTNKGAKNKAGSASSVDDSLVEVEVVVMGARKLPKADVFGSSDPYAVGIWQRKKVVTTDIIMDNLNPNWNSGKGVRATITVSSADANKGSKLQFEVFDWDRVGDHDLLGKCAIPATILLRPPRVRNEFPLLDPDGGGQNVGTLILDLHAHAASNNSNNSSNTSSSSSSSSSSGGTSAARGPTLLRGALKQELDVEVVVLRCNDLAKADTFGKSDPFVECFWRGVLAHKTKVVKSSLDPEFSDESFAIAVPLAAANNVKMAKNNVLVCEVYDADVLTKGDFLGRCEISSQDLLHPTTSVLTYPLEPKPGLSEKQLKLVRGTISVQPSPLPFGRGRATPPLKLPNVIKKKKKKRTAGKSKSNGADYDDDDDDDDEDEVEVALDPTAERARLEQEGKPLPPLPEEDEERSHVGEDATTALNTTNELLKAPAEENIERRGEHGRGGEAKMSRSKAGPPSTLAFKGVTGIEHTAGTAAPESSSSLDAASLSSNSTNAKQQQTAASSAPPAPPLSRSVTELGAGQLMDALLRGTKGLNMVPGDPPRVVYPFADEALWLTKENKSKNGNNSKEGSSFSHPPVPVSAETEAAAAAARAAAAALGATVTTTNVLPNATTMASGDATATSKSPLKQLNSTTLSSPESSNGPLDKYALVLTLNDQAADRTDHRFDSPLVDEFSHDDEDDDASVMSTSTRGDYSMASTSTAQTSKPKSTAKLHAHDVLGPADVAFVQASALCLEQCLHAINARMRRSAHRAACLATLKRAADQVVAYATTGIHLPFTTSAGTSANSPSMMGKLSFGENFNAASAAIWLVGLLKRGLPVEWECGLSLANTKGDGSSSSSPSLSQRGRAPGESMLVHLFHSSATVPLVGRYWQRGQHASFDVLDSGHTLLVAEEKGDESNDDEKDKADEEISPPSFSFEREAKNGLGLETVASEQRAMSEPMMPSSLSLSSTTSVKLAHSTWPAGFAVSQMLDVPLPKVEDSVATAVAASSSDAASVGGSSTEPDLESKSAKWDPASMWCLATNGSDGSSGQSDGDDDDSASVAAEGTELDVSILSATGLAKADTFGKSDPRCEVYWSSQLVHTTTTMHKTLDPIWRLEKVKVRVSNDGQSAVFAEKEKANAVTDAADTASIAADASLEVSEHKGGTNDTSSTTVVDTSNSAVNNQSVWEQGLVVEVYDMDMGRRGSFLGRVALSTDEVLELARVFEGQPSSEPPERPSEAGSRKKGPKKGQVVLDLQPKPGLSAKDLKFVQGSITLSVAALGDLPPTAQEIARIEAEEAAAAAAAESEGGSGDTPPVSGVLPPAVASYLAARYAQQTTKLALRNKALQPGVSTAQLLAQGSRESHSKGMRSGLVGSAPVPTTAGGGGGGGGGDRGADMRQDGAAADDADHMPAELRLAVLKQYAPALPVAILPSEMHEVKDTSRAPFVMAPLLGNGGLGVGVLSVRMATSVITSKDGDATRGTTVNKGVPTRGASAAAGAAARTPQLLNPLVDEHTPEPYQEWLTAKGVATKSALQAVKDRAAAAAEQDRTRREKEASEAVQARAQEDKARAVAARKKREARAGRGQVGRRGAGSSSNAVAAKKKNQEQNDDDEDEDDSWNSDDADGVASVQGGVSENENAAVSKLDENTGVAEGTIENDNDETNSGVTVDAITADPEEFAAVEDENTLAAVKDTTASANATAVPPLVPAPVPISDSANNKALDKSTPAAAAAVVKKKPTTAAVVAKEEELMSSPIPSTDPLRGYLEGTPGLPIAALNSFLTANSGRSGGGGGDSGVPGASFGPSSSMSLSSPMKAHSRGGATTTNNFNANAISGQANDDAEEGDVVSWESLLAWARLQGDDGSMPRDPEVMDADVVSYIRDCGEELGRSLDALRKANTLQQVLPTPLLEPPPSALGLARDEEEGDDDSEKEDEDGGVLGEERGSKGAGKNWNSNNSGMLHSQQQQQVLPSPMITKIKSPNVFCACVQDVYTKAIAVLWRSFPRLLSVDVWQLCEAPSQPRPLLSLRSVLGRNESEPISLESARSGGLAELSGNLPWATPALRALHDQWPSAGDIEQAHAVDDTTSSAAAVNENLLFRSSSGQVLVPFFDPGPRGTFLAQSPVSQSSSSSSSSSSKGKRKQQVLRRHALVLTGDPRFPWDACPAALARVALHCSQHIRQVRQAEDAIAGKKEEALAAARRADNDGSSDSDDGNSD